MHVGADEAGKGPVLGPMVVAAVRADPATLPDGITDSKQLSPARRETLAAALHTAEGVDICLAVVAAEDIDDPETDMNSLTVNAQAAAVAGVARTGDEIVVDAGDVSESRFARRIRDGVCERTPGLRDEDADLAITAEHGADDAYPIVGAASIVAKVERDARVRDIAAEYGEVGSGYPSDPTTRRFLREYVREHGEIPDCARRSWSTCDDLLAAAEQSSLGDF